MSATFTANEDKPQRTLSERLFASDHVRTSGLDYLLTAIGGSLALFSLGQGVARPEVGWILMGFFLLGTLLSWLIQTLGGHHKIVQADGVFYCVFALFGGLFSSSLSMIFGENPFPEQLGAAGMVAWILVLGAFASWRDQTLLFQAVPCIAIFGLVGCYDTFQPAAFLFFGFLLCLSTLFARVQSRTMMKLALQSKVRTALDQDEAVMSIRQGAWRAVAGPEWALGSAGVIVLISLVGAPVIQDSMSGVAGAVRVTLPVPKNIPPPPNLPLSGEGNRIGRGPVRLSDAPILYYQGDKPRYLRSRIYRSYTDGAWTRSAEPDMTKSYRGSMDMFKEASAKIKDPVRISFSIQALSPRLDSLPTPGEVLSLDAKYDVNRRRDGTFSMNQARRDYPAFPGVSVVARDSVRPTKRAEKLPESLYELTSTKNISPTIADFASKVTRNATNDIERAEAIKLAIARQCLYNQNVQPTPPDKDPVDYFLFESHEGYCDVFASSMVLMARSVGIPARYVVGFYPFDGVKDERGRWLVRERDSHAWAELFFEDAGWVVFDATEGAAEAPGSERGNHDDRPYWQRPWVQAVSIGTIMVGLIIYLLVRTPKVFNPGARAESKQKTDESRAKAIVGRSYASFVRTMERQTRVRRQPSQTPNEYLEAVSPHLNGSPQTAEELTGAFVNALYSPVALNLEEANALKTRTDAFLKVLKRGGKP